MASRDFVEPIPFSFPEREDWLTECPLCPRLVSGDDPDESLQAWRDHLEELHVP